MSRNAAAQFQREELHRAAQEGDLARANDLVARKYRLNRFVIGNTPLSDCVRGCMSEIAKVLVEAGADPTIRCWMENVPTVVN